MEQQHLLAISPLDGRYHAKLTELVSIFSEYALFEYRTYVELEWFKALADNPAIEELPPLSDDALQFIDQINQNFSATDAQIIKNIEKTINHDVKAVEYFLKEKFQQHDELAPYVEFIHFACTSEDINNLAYALMLKDARDNILIPEFDNLQKQLKSLSNDHKSQALLARTHGQAASPTTLGKEFANVLCRLNRQISVFSKVHILGKINGAVGNYNAHRVTYPEIDWPAHCENFVSSLGLKFNCHTTQIEPHDYIAEYAHALIRINTILLDLDKDCWHYIALGYFQQKMQKDEVGSSTMPHKVNPIDFENSEGNLGLANALLAYFAEKLPQSRWQRDLSDSTVLRNLGVAVGYSVLAYQASLKGLKKLQANSELINQDLDQHWEVLGEAIQTIMRRYNIPEPYEKLKAFSRGKTLDEAMTKAFIRGLDLPAHAKNTLLNLRPADYIGYASELTEKLV